MQRIGRGCHELGIVDRDATFRIIYHVDADAIVILDVFSKKSRGTPKQAVEACKRRLTMYKALRA